MTTEVVQSTAGRIEVRGPLTFATANAAYPMGLRLLASASSGLQIDCSGVTDSDSAGLATLLGWLASARRHALALRFTHLPQRLEAVARISEVDELLGAQA